MKCTFRTGWVKTGESDRVTFHVPPEAKYMLRRILTRGDSLTVTVNNSRPRSTGDRSQNHHINGHCQQIAMETGNDFAMVKFCAKRRAMSMGYPYRRGEHGEPIYSIVDHEPEPISETEATTEDAALLIEAAHQLAAELDIRLEEGEGEQE